MQFVQIQTRFQVTHKIPKAQKRISPSGTAIILSLEGFFGSLFSVLLGLDKATPTFIIGGAIILLSVIAVQIEPGLKSSN